MVLNLGVDQFAAAIALANSAARVVPPLNKAVTWLERLGVDNQVAGFLTAHSFDRDLVIGSLGFNRLDDLVDLNEDPRNHQVYRDALLILGSARNGDPVTLNWTNGRAGYLSHDLLWEAEERPQVAAVHVELPVSFGDHYLRSQNSHAWPADWYEASAWVRGRSALE